MRAAIIVVGVVGVVGVVLASGCNLTEEQRQSIDRLHREAQALEARAKAAEARFRETQQRLLDGEITTEDAAAVYQSIMAQVGEINESRESIAREIESARESGLPWYGYLVPILGLLGGVGATYARGEKWRTAFEVVSRGADAFASSPSGGLGGGLGDAIERELARTSLSKRELRGMHERARESARIVTGPSAGVDRG